MQYKLNIGKLKPGDIILVGYNDTTGREIQRRTESDFSHAMLYWRGSILHAADIVITFNPSRMLFEEDESVCILRLKDEYWNVLRIKDLIDYARRFVGTFYDKRALIALRDGKKVEPKVNRQMCARYVAECFDYVCLDLVEDYELCTPEDIYKSKIVYPVDNPLLEATPWDIAFYNSYDVTEHQFEAIKGFLVSLKRRFPQEDIVSLLQLEEFIKKNPDNGDIALELLKKTEYFDLWSLEREHCQYLYNVEEFKNFWEDEKVAIHQALAIIDESKEIIGEKQGDILEYQKRRETIADIEYYREMIELREHIIKTAKERIDVAEKVLADYRVVKIKMPWIS